MCGCHEISSFLSPEIVRPLVSSQALVLLRRGDKTSKRECLGIDPNAFELKVGALDGAHAASALTACLARCNAWDRAVDLGCIARQPLVDRESLVSVPWNIRYPTHGLGALELSKESLILAMCLWQSCFRTQIGIYIDNCNPLTHDDRMSRCRSVLCRSRSVHGSTLQFTLSDAH
jgi:hypothetical protein